MPHCIIEYSDNVVDPVDLKQFMLEINDYLASTGYFKLNDIKTRVLKSEQYVIGDGDPIRTFVTVNLLILSGRDDTVKKELSDGLLKILEKHYPKTVATTKASLTVQITDMHKGSYGRIKSYDD